MIKKNQGASLIEVLIALLLVSVISIGIWSVELFSREHVVSADRRAQTQNEAAYVLEHMVRVMTGPGRGGAIGDVSHPAVDYVDLGGGEISLRFYVDSNLNGRRDALDRRLEYHYYPGTKQNAYRLFYKCLENCDPGTPAGDGALISKNLAAFSIPYHEEPNHMIERMDYIPVVFSVCWDVTRQQAGLWCGTSRNPVVSLRARIRMPAVSLN